jgi:hypothetical protein
VVKVLIATAATLAMISAASAADLPQRQPVYAKAPYVGKDPIGKSPVGKYPVGKGPLVARY